MTISAFALAAAAGMCSIGRAQGTGAPPAFEVATIKPDPSGSAAMNFQIAPGRFRAENATVEALIRFAYNVKTSDGIEEGPKWTSSKRFDIDAKIADSDAEKIKELPPPQRFEQYRLMMRSLLGERFGLRTSTRTKELPEYELIVAKSGPKLTPVESAKQHMPWLWGGSRGELHAASVSMPFFCDWISGREDIGGRVVVDKTELTGSYDFTLKWTPVESGPSTLAGAGTNGTAASTSAVEESEPSLFTAIQEQLGLKLVSAKGPVQVLAIDHVGQPTEN
jgi:uncharacterized protein (TIGR03435 family)